ncbi:hypothetical protein BI364_16630 [Acidihalobacter yilgarnensis]|uniref:Uncharacterized protein n=1 Tax=Acidihalobacter yilgarnensis TaxID=2819280 RepID=A0A1D8IS21_9GAMM|nr:hypothetical protein [Acidihalobacter yilgarnensis]AOU99338.1 hypothetical protein BI364_16630 [Acidihalobacter yilgarnensis]
MTTLRVSACVSRLRPLLRLCAAMLFGALMVDVLATLSLHLMLRWPVTAPAAWPQALAGVYVAAEFPWYVIQHGMTSAFGLTAFEDRLLEPYQGAMPIELLAIGLPVLWVLLSYLGLRWFDSQDIRRVAGKSSPPYNARGLIAGMGFVLLYVAGVLLIVHAAVDGFAVIDFKLLAR